MTCDCSSKKSLKINYVKTMNKLDKEFAEAIKIVNLLVRQTAYVKACCMLVRIKKFFYKNF